MSDLGTSSGDAGTTNAAPNQSSSAQRSINASDGASNTLQMAMLNMPRTGNFASTLNHLSRQPLPGHSLSRAGLGSDGRVSPGSESNDADGRKGAQLLPDDWGQSEPTMLLKSGGLWDQLRQQDERRLSAERFDSMVVGTTAVTTSALTAGYVVWMLRSGFVITSVVSQIPAWTIIDPLSLLEESDDGESLATMIEKEPV